ncbi:MAG: DUF4271 domain-containing protein [Muribaculaceae bacterium]|nr:DUF4271 domain-containing protein [Muribaculaceae bacterium]
MVQEGTLALSVPEVPASDSIASDSLELEQEPVYGILLTPPQSPPPAELRQGGSEGVSFILTGIFILFLIIALRFRNNIKYALTMFRNLVETRTRHNVFDDTVRETSLIVLLNLLWCASAGIIGFTVFHAYFPSETPWPLRSIGMLWGMAIAAVYTLFMWWAYAAVGWIFSDRTHSSLWVKGYSASQALMAPPFFITALVAICQPQAASGVAVAAFTFFILVKLAFIWKGYRIFFNQFSSWVLFLCYLCSLEIVPLILCYRCAVVLGEVL